jgi:hypothetical protein
MIAVAGVSRSAADSRPAITRRIIRQPSPAGALGVESSASVGGRVTRGVPVAGLTSPLGVAVGVAVGTTSPVGVGVGVGSVVGVGVGSAVGVGVGPTFWSKQTSMLVISVGSWSSPGGAIRFVSESSAPSL